MGAGASAQLSDNVTLDEAKAYAGDAWTDDAQKAFDASASNGTTTRRPSPRTARTAAAGSDEVHRGQGAIRRVADDARALAVDGLPKGFRSTRARRINY